jgi:hypothetical protein
MIELSLALSLLNTLRDTVWFWKENAPEEDVKDNEEMLKLQEQLEEKESRLQTQREIIQEKAGQVDEFENILNTLKNDNISVEDLVEKYWRDSTILLVCISRQEDATGEQKSFIREELQEKYDLIRITSKTWVVPPAQFPERLKEKSNRKEIKEWLDDEIFAEYEGHRALVPFVTAVDLKNVHSHTDFDSDEINDPANLLREELGLSRLMTEEEFSEELASKNINLEEVIESGHISFFVSNFVTDDDLTRISKNRESIEEELEDELGSLSLYSLADDEAIDPLHDALEDYIPYPEKVAQGAVEVAKMWEGGLQEIEIEESERKDDDASPPVLEAQ